MDDRVDESILRVAKRNHSALVRGISTVSGKRVADLIGVSESTLSGMKSEHLERFSALAAACGLKFVSTSERSLDERHISALETLAAIALRRSNQSDRPREEE